MVCLRERQQVFEDWDQRPIRVRIFRAPFLVLKLQINLVPAYPFTIVPDGIVRSKHQLGLSQAAIEKHSITDVEDFIHPSSPIVTQKGLPSSILYD